MKKRQLFMCQLSILERPSLRLSYSATKILNMQENEKKKKKKKKKKKPYAWCSSRVSGCLSKRWNHKHTHIG